MSVGRKKAMIKVALVSSYHIDCGIAQYVEYIEPELNKSGEIDVTILPLPVDVSRANTGAAKRITKEKYIELCNELKKYDVTILEWEPGLFGVTPFEIIRRVKNILKASSKILIVHHTVPNLSPSANRFTLNLRRIIGDVRKNLIFNFLFRMVRRNQKKYRHIVHTNREYQNFTWLGILGEYIRVSPLAYLNDEKLNEFHRNRDEIYNSAVRKLNIENSGDVKLIGCFGYLSPYKGIEVAIDTLTKLPEEYHLVIVGGLHPQAIMSNSIFQPYVNKLLKLIEKNRKLIGSRIHFVGSPDNELFVKLMYSCDAIVLPYAEVGQTSSGPASMALDMNKAIYCSHNPYFAELNKFIPGILEMFEIGNSYELAEKLIKDTGNFKDSVVAREIYHSKYNLSTRASLYIELVKELAKE